MNLSNLKAGLTKNRAALGALGAVAVVALAWRARSSAPTNATDPASDVAQPAGSSTVPSYYTGGAAYDSSASDVYNALQPQLEAVGNAVDDLKNLIPVPGAPTTPAPAPEAPTVQGWFRRAGSAAVYRALSDGTLDWVDAAEYAGAGSPTYTDIAANDPLWNRNVSGGADAPGWSKVGYTP